MKPQEIQEAFTTEGGRMIDGVPVIDAYAHKTKHGTAYLRDPGVVVVAHTVTKRAVLAGFLGGFDPSLEFSSYLEDDCRWQVVTETTESGKTILQPDESAPLQPLPESALLVKIAGQLCYMSFGPDRTMNRETVKYIWNLVSSGHGSVLEHPSVSILFYGVSRSFTHELVRHRAGMGYSQLSQRYVDGSRLRFVERPEYQSDAELHARFEQEIDRQAAEYEFLAQRLLSRQQRGTGLLSGETKRDRRKKANQAARSVLGNHAEASIVATGNLRAWRHILNMRASKHAETEIRRAAYREILCLATLDPIVFGDFRITEYFDKTRGVSTAYPKV